MTKQLHGLNGGFYCGFLVGPDGKTPNPRGRALQVVTEDNILCVGPTGSGKTFRTLIPNILVQQSASMIIHDPDATIYKLTHQARRELGEVIVCDPYLITGSSNGFDLVGSIDSDAEVISEFCDELAEVTVTVKSEINPFFEETAQEGVSAGLQQAALRGHTIKYLSELFGKTGPDRRKEFDQIVKTGDTFDLPELQQKAARFIENNKDDRELMSVISTAKTALKFLHNRPITKDLSQGTIDFRAFKQDVKTLYIILPAKKLWRVKTYLNLLLHSAVSAMLEKPGKATVPVYFFMDEASQLKVPLIENTLTMWRKYGLKLITYWQDKATAELALGRRFAAYTANSSMQIAFAPNDYETAQLFARRAGEQTVMAQGLTTSLGERNDKLGVGLSPHKAPVVHPADLMGFPAGFSILYSPEHRHPVTVYFPDPREIPAIAAILARAS